MSRQQSLIAACVFAAASLAAPAWAASEHFHADLKGSSEVPPNNSAGSGTADATFDTGSNALDWTMSWSGLSGKATMAHFHGPAAAGKNAGVLVVLGMDANGGLTPPLHGTATLTAQQAAALEAGLFYVNVHTPAHPKGEIRGQVVKAP